MKASCCLHGGAGQGVSTCVFRKADGQWGLLDLLLKDVLLVKKQDDGCVCEPFVVADAVEKLQGFMHAVLQQSREASQGWQCPGPDPPQPLTQRNKQRKGPPMRLNASPRHGDGRTHGTTSTWALLHSTRRQGWGATPRRRADPGRGSKVTGVTPAPREDMHHARRDRGSTTIQRVLHGTGHADVNTRKSFGLPAGVGECTHSVGKH